MHPTLNLTDNEKRDIVKYLEAGKPLPEKYRFLLFDDDREVELLWNGDYIFDNEWQSFRTKKNRNLDLASSPKVATKGNHKIAVKVVDIFGNDTTKVIEIKI